MNPFLLTALLLCLATVPNALATVVSAGPSNETFTLTGLGANVSGEGQTTMTLGNCIFDGTNTTCSLTGPYSGLGGGTFRILQKYPGNGPSPITLTSVAPGSDTVSATLANGSLQMILTGTNGTATTFYYTFFYFQSQSGASAACTGVLVCSIGQVGLTKGATLTNQFTGTLDPTPMIPASPGIFSASQYGGFRAIAPATWMEIYGYNVGTVLARQWGGADFNGSQAPTSLAGTTVTVAGVPAYIDYVSPNQVNAQVPSGIAPGLQPVVVTTAGGSSDPTMVMVNAVEPGVLAPTAFVIGGLSYVAAFFPGGKTYVLPPGITNQVPTARAKPGDVIMFYGVGFGAVTPDISAGQVQGLNTSPLQASFQVSFAGTPATVVYAGQVYNNVGLYQFNVVVPSVAASDSVPLTFTLGNVSVPQNLVIPIGN